MSSVDCMRMMEQAAELGFLKPSSMSIRNGHGTWAVGSKNMPAQSDIDALPVKGELPTKHEGDILLRAIIMEFC
ncbi:hypothetical protein WG66_016875 [Moniliophthora roreri]|nr:hypothetical protein WG66_016875 [Moniliophthora roreri]